MKTDLERKENIASGTFWTKVGMKLLWYVLFFVILLVIMVWLMEDQIIYHPVKYPSGNWSPPEMETILQDVTFQAEDDVRLHGWWAPREDTNQTLLWFHGNAGNLSHRYQDVIRFHEIGVQVLIVDYRGYGRSEGSPSEEGLYQDGRAAYRFLRMEKNISPEQIHVLGRSLGAAVATKLAVAESISSLILVSPFTNVRDMVPQVLPIPGLHHVVQSEFNSLARIQDVNVPLLVIHGEQDDIIPIEIGKKLYEKANDPKRFVSIENAGHNDILLGAGTTYEQAIREHLFPESTDSSGQQ